MDDIKIRAFEAKIVEICNGVPISNRMKYYVLKDISEKLLEASERDVAVTTALLNKQKEEKEGGEE